MNKNKIVLIIDDQEIIQWALKIIIEESFSDIMLRPAITFSQGIDQLQRNHIDLVILDIELPGGNGPAMISQLRLIQPDVPILVYTGLKEEDYSHQYLTAGADGFLSKNAPFHNIAAALTTVLSGKKYISLESQSILAERYLKNPTKKRKFGYEIKLTDREKQIARLLIQGKWTKEIADQLDIKLSTVSTHKLHILEKFEVTTIVELYRKAVKEMPELLK